MQSKAAWLLACVLTLAVLVPASAEATTGHIDTDCASIARHHDGISFGYRWGTMTACHGGTVFTAKRKAALTDMSWLAFPDMVKSQVCNKGYFVRKGKTVFVAKHKATVRTFQRTYKTRYHARFGGNVKPISTMPSYQPESWC